MICINYRIIAYYVGTRDTAYTSTTNSLTTAEHYARSLKKDYDVVVINTETGERYAHKQISSSSLSGVAAR